MEPREKLKLELQDSEFAAFYGADQAQMQLALALIAARDKLKLTQKEMAANLNVSQPYVAKLETGDANPTIGKIGSILALVGLRPVVCTAPLLEEEPMFSQITAFLRTPSGTENTMDATEGFQPMDFGRRTTTALSDTVGSTA